MRKTLKRGARGSTEDEESNSKRLNMAATKTTEAMVAGSDDEARGGGELPYESDGDARRLA